MSAIPKSAQDCWGVKQALTPFGGCLFLFGIALRTLSYCTHYASYAAVGERGARCAGRIRCKRRSDDLFRHVVTRRRVSCLTTMKRPGLVAVATYCCQLRNYAEGGRHHARLNRLRRRTTAHLSACGMTRQRNQNKKFLRILGERCEAFLEVEMPPGSFGTGTAVPDWKCRWVVRSRIVGICGRALLENRRRTQPRRDGLVQ